MRALINLALEQGNGRLDDALFIFPHTRPARYLERLIRLDGRMKKPCLLPRTLTTGALFEAILAETSPPAAQAGMLDMVGLLLECAREETKAPSLTARLPVERAEEFFPWGVRLVNLFEECFIHNRVPANLPHLEDELLPFAAALLSRLAELYQRYVRKLEERGWTTPGFTAQKAIKMLSTPDASSFSFAAGHIYIAGFYSLNGSEEVLFRRLWTEKQADIVLHADPKLAEDQGHWSCSGIKSWQKNWGTTFKLAETDEAHDTPDPEINFYSGYDIHSQLAVLRDLTSSANPPPAGASSPVEKEGEKNPAEAALNELDAETAIILTDAALLTPVLHHINTFELNISMGYPLTGAPLHRFLESLLVLHENARSGGYYWKDCIRLLRQPYVKMLDDQRGGGEWRELLLRTEHALRRGSRYVRLHEIMLETAMEAKAEKNLEKLSQLCEMFKLVFIDIWPEAGSLKSLGESLKKVCVLLLEKGENLWPRFPLDAECLYRFMQFVLPALEQSSLSAELLSRSALFSIFRELIRAERVPFDAYPLTAMQIMGLLESRLLNFNTVYVLDATDDALPGSAGPDPLLPEGLRNELGLPGEARRGLMIAYYFFRLIQSANKIHLLWQEGVESGKLQDAKKEKSRYIEELLWQLEKKRGKLFQPEHSGHIPSTSVSVPLLTDGPLHQLNGHPVPLRPSHRMPEISAPARSRLKHILGAPLSATLLNGYLRCPASFYYREVARLTPLEEVNEDDDPLAVGDLFHQTLREFYLNKLGRPLLRKSLSRGELADTFRRSAAENPKILALPADARAMLQLAGPRRLDDFLRHQPEETTVLALETSWNAPLTTTDGVTHSLIGRMDRLDARLMADQQKGLLILDYKSGRISHIEPDFWRDESIWNNLRPDRVKLDDTSFFNLIADAVRDVQLPLYLYLAAFGRMQEAPTPADQQITAPWRVCNAAWVNLREQGKELFLFPESMEQHECIEIVEDKIELLLDYILRHLTHAKVFSPRPGVFCAYCPFQEICIVL
ncbi:MAG: PD-(D/E)XK nuclease family protein [Deltaproteobacteria bacterium]|nr:PD-(D/E)XK nuclease family protein [Deltaproteobacteria bacterium]